MGHRSKKSQGANERRVYAVLMQGIFCLLLGTLFLALAFAVDARAREPLNLQFSVTLERLVKNPSGDEWTPVHRVGIIDGIGAAQLEADPEQTYRIRFTALKPYDLKGTFKARMPDRSDGVVAPAGAAVVSIVFGPQPGCQDEPRCMPFTTSDVGYTQLRLDLERADKTSFGMVSLYPVDALDRVVRLALTYKDKPVQCGDQVDKGWWIFARSMRADADPLDTISVCVREPDGDWKCADDREHEVRKKINEKGKYLFVSWSREVLPSTCEVTAK